MANELRRRIPSLGTGIMFVLLVLSIGGVSWWLNRPKSDSGPTGPSLPDLDVVCLGRIDGLERITELDARIPGKVAEVFVTEGQHVGPKEKLLRLDDEALKLRVEEAQAAIAAVDIEIEAAKLEEKLHPSRQRTQEAAVVSAGDRIIAAKRVYEEKKIAKTFGTVTGAELVAAEAEVKQLEQLEGIEKARLEELKLADPTLKVRAAQTKRTATEIALKQARHALAECVLLSPTAGTVLRVQTAAGKGIAPGTPIPAIIFRPDGQLVVWAELEQEFLGRVKPGMKAVIRDDARVDSPTWNGKVLQIGHLVARKRSILLDPGEMNDVRTVECAITIEGDTSSLLVGQRMRVRIGRGD